MTFVVTATWKAKAGQADVIRDVIRTMGPLSRAEPSNLDFVGHVSPQDPSRFFLYEQYESADGYERHKASSYFQEHVIGRAIPNLEYREVVVYEILERGSQA